MAPGALNPGDALPVSAHLKDKSAPSSEQEDNVHRDERISRMLGGHCAFRASSMPGQGGEPILRGREVARLSLASNLTDSVL
jgi:hypothetical protein